MSLLPSKLAWFFYLLLAVSLVRCETAADGNCDGDADDGDSASCQVKDESICDLPLSLCRPSSRSKDIYRNGGSAQAYKPNQPDKEEICDPNLYNDSSSHRVATWPYSASNRKAPPARVKVTLKLWSCSLPNGVSTDENVCCCSPLVGDSQDDAETSTSGSAVVEIWQARPTGRYSSLRVGQEDGDCRVRREYSSSGDGLSFETVAPGSTGSLGGLGPAGWDFAPYGPPELHVLVTDRRHAPTLVNIPVLPHRTTLESQEFRGVDWRGAAWVRDSEKDAAFSVTSWQVDPRKDRIELEVDVYLQAADDDTRTTKNEDESVLSEKLCRSWVYGLPASFFLEPIAECAPSMLDFFAL